VPGAPKRRQGGLAILPRVRMMGVGKTVLGVAFMCTGLALRTDGVAGSGPIGAWLRRCKPARLSGALLGVALCSVVLASCSTNHTFPGIGNSHTASAAVPTRLASRKFHARQVRAVIAPLPEPDCNFKSGPGGDHGADNGEALRMKLDYERQCWRQAEMILRDRLQQLQASIAPRGPREPADR
jgi:hypothetical protein